MARRDGDHCISGSDYSFIRYKWYTVISCRVLRSFKEQKLRPRIAEVAKLLWILYFSLTVLCAIAYWFAGMNAFDAIGHSFSTVANGGFSTHDASMGYFNNATIYLITTFFMLIAGLILICIFPR